MRQSGILAAAGLYALKHNVHRLAEDHHRTKTLAESLAKMPGLNVDVPSVQTNIIMVEVKENAANWASELAKMGILCMPFSETRLRLVFHADVDDAGLQQSIEAFRELTS